MVQIGTSEDGMPTTIYTPDRGTRSTYRYEIGRIDWNGRQMNAIVIGDFPFEGGCEAGAIPVRVVIVNQILAENPDVSEGVWTVFIKRPPRLPFPEWELIESGFGKQSLPEGKAPSGDIPARVVHQLEGSFGL